jgi:hypothetical protein
MAHHELATSSTGLFPQTLPPFLARPHSREPLPVDENVEVDSGPDRKYRFFRNAPEVLTAALQLAQAQYDIFYLWGETDLRAWTFNFYVQVAGPEYDSGLEWWLARWVKPPKAKFENGYGYYVTGQLRLLTGPYETRPSAGTCEGEFDLMIVVDADLFTPKFVSAAVSVTATVDADLSKSGQQVAAAMSFTLSMDAALSVDSAASSAEMTAIGTLDANLNVGTALAAEAAVVATVDANLTSTGGAVDTRVTSTGDIRVTSTGDTRTTS